MKDLMHKPSSIHLSVRHTNTFLHNPISVLHQEQMEVVQSQQIKLADTEFETSLCIVCPHALCICVFSIYCNGSQTQRERHWTFSTAVTAVAADAVCDRPGPNTDFMHKSERTKVARRVSHIRESVVGAHTKTLNHAPFLNLIGQETIFQKNGLCAKGQVHLTQNTLFGRGKTS